MVNTIRQLLGITPDFIVRGLRIRRERREIQRIQRLECNVEYLKSWKDIDLSDLFASHETEMRWNDAKKTIDMFVVPDGTGGVNPGDRRAIFYLISKFKPSSVLEIGTHIGASTVHIASALYMNQVSEDGIRAILVSVDMADVNDPISKPWLEHGTILSPIEMINKMNLETFVEFLVDSSLNYFSKCDTKFDFIFLDGDHAAKTVYQELPAALNLLNEGGMILLHDYFPDLKPLWSNGSVIPGPYVATERLKDEGVNMNVMPLNELPWPTKSQSNATSLALLYRVTSR